MTQTESRVSFPALGGTAVVAVRDGAALSAARAAAEQTVAEFDLACSRFRDDSELSALNAAAGSPVRVSPLLLEAVTASLRAARLTGGDVDPTIGQALIALGYDRDFADLTPGDSGAAGAGDSGPAGAGDSAPAGAGGSGAAHVRSISVASVPGWRTVQVDPGRSTIRLGRGVKLDLGATAKALAADRAAARAHAAAGCGVLVSLSGDLAIAGRPPGEGWRVRVTDDHRSEVDAPGQWITLRAGGLATSSTMVRGWQAGSRFAHHLVDPATGRPVAVVWRTVSVSAASCLDANIASTAAIVRGEEAVAWLESLRLPSRLVRPDGTVRHLAGWPSRADDLTAERSEVLA
jgi:FAD:protein FMN transferase